MLQGGIQGAQQCFPLKSPFPLHGFDGNEVGNLFDQFQEQRFIFQDMQFLFPAASHQADDPDGMAFRQDRHGQFDFFRTVEKIGTALADQFFPGLVNDPAFPGFQYLPVHMAFLGHTGIHPCREHAGPGDPVQVVVHHFHIHPGDFRNDPRVRSHRPLDVPEPGPDFVPCFFHREYAPFSFAALILLFFLKKRKGAAAPPPAL